MGEVARTWRETEMQVVGVERVTEYINNEHEANWKSIETISSDWPQAGEIVFEDFCFRYKPETPLVLKGLNFRVNSKEKIGEFKRKNR